MSAPEQYEAQRSRCKISTTAKGEATLEVSVLAGESEAEMERIRKLAVATYNEAARELGGRMAGT